MIRDTLEKVLRLSEILKYVSNNNMPTGCLALKGGTAINLLLSEAPRLSVDIDYDFCTTIDKNEMMIAREQISTDILSYMLSEGYIL